MIGVGIVAGAAILLIFALRERSRSTEPDMDDILDTIRTKIEAEDHKSARR